MAYDKETYSVVTRQFEESRARAQAQAQARRSEVYERIPEIAEIAATLAQIGAEVCRSAMLEPGESTSAILALQKRQQQLIARRAELLASAGYPPDYLEPPYRCKKCNDSGYIGTKRCECFERALAAQMFRRSNLANLEHQSFESFDLSYYPAAAGKGEVSPRERMEKVLSYTKDYAQNFGSKRENLLFIGPPGLGKTFLSTAVAKVVISLGFSVLYDTAQNIFSCFEREKFAREDTCAPSGSFYLDCDLLIIDDLGAEFTTPLTLATLYNLINTRTTAGRPIIISTNLTLPELEKLYNGRIFSRLIGEFTALAFYGTDIRQQKLRKR
jgi:DNA replication protein DnaC